MKRIIKTISLISLLLLVCLQFESCKKSPEQSYSELLAKTMAEVELPRTLREGDVLTNCSYSDNTIVYNIELGQKSMKDWNQESLRTKTMEKLAAGLFSKNLLLVASKARANIKIVLTNGEDTIEKVYTPQELEYLLR